MGAESESLMSPVASFFLGLAVIPVLALGYGIYWWIRMGREVAK
jgi:hypothetical protein